MRGNGFQTGSLELQSELFGADYISGTSTTASSAGYQWRENESGNVSESGSASERQMLSERAEERVGWQTCSSWRSVWSVPLICWTGKRRRRRGSGCESGNDCWLLSGCGSAWGSAWGSEMESDHEIGTASGRSSQTGNDSSTSSLLPQ